MRAVIGFLTLAAMSGIFYLACSPGKDSADGSDDLGSSSSGTGGDAGHGSSGSGGDAGFDPGENDGGLTDGEVCEAVEADAQDIPLDMVVVLDRSASMGTKWDQSVSALNTFFTSASSEGISVAMSFFPIDGPSDTCNPNHYNPPHVPLGELSAYAPTLASAMAAQDDSGSNTPTYGALMGTYQFATAYQDDNPDRKVIIVFGSDGSPNSCPDNQNTTSVIAALAASAFNYNGVETYVIAIQGSSVSDLDQIAAAGGTSAAFDVTSDTTQFSVKMEEIRAQALGCEYLIPDPTSDEFDATKVNVTYTPGGSGSPQQLPRADNAADCGTGQGWYYDDPTEPTKIFLCPASCTVVTSDPEAHIGFAFGCPTEVN